MELMDKCNTLEKQIDDIFNKTDLSESQKKELIWNIVKNEKNKQQEDFKLYPIEDNEESNHRKYQTKNGKYSLIIAYDNFHRYGWYFYGGNNSNINRPYNSLWEKKSYKTEENCVENAQLWLKKTILTEK